MSLILTFDRAHLKRIVAATEAATSFSPTFEDMYDPAIRKDGREPGPNELAKYDDIDLTKLKPGLHLVADHGVYLLSNANNEDGQKRDVAYAKEGDPTSNSDEWQFTRAAVFGGDDGVEFLPLSTIKTWLDRSGHERARLIITSSRIDFL